MAAFSIKYLDHMDDIAYFFFKFKYDNMTLLLLPTV